MVVGGNDADTTSNGRCDGVRRRRRRRRRRSVGVDAGSRFGDGHGRLPTLCGDGADGGGSVDGDEGEQ
jgi:hypothetical protein